MALEKSYFSTVKPLDGIRILDLTRLLPGPMCTMHLADMGADVIKIEDPKVGDYARTIPPLQKAMSPFFLSINRNKRSVKLDVSTSQGREVFLKLTQNADVVVESFRPGVMKKMGIDYEVLKAINPKLVFCSITGYGQTGPYKAKAGHDLNYMATSGLLKKAPGSIAKPSIPNLQIADLLGGAMNAAMGILAAIIQQKNTGKGQYIDVSMLDGVLANSVIALGHRKSVDQLGMDTSDMLNGALHFYSIYECKDGRYVALAALESKFWERFCEAANKPDWKSQYLVMGEAAQSIRKEVEQFFMSKSLVEWVNYFKDVDCCISPVNTLEEALTNEQIRARNMVVTSNHPTEGEVTHYGLPVQFTDSSFEILHPAPSHGEHTMEILLELGYSEEFVKNQRLI